MENKIDHKLSDILGINKELEGGLFANITLTYCMKDFVARKDLYTVKKGIVYGINKDGFLFPTGDSLSQLKIECHRIGKYDPNKKYTFKSNTLSYSEVKKLLKL